MQILTLRPPAAVPRAPSLWVWPAVLAGHAALGLLAERSALVSTMHALASVAAAGVVALHTRRLVRVAQAGAYLAVADVLWRSTEARFFWEGVKYAVAAVLVVALLRFFRSWRDLGAPALYLAMFLPAILLSVLVLGVSGIARGLISANLSGPLVLAVGAAFFAQVRPTGEGLRLVLWSMLGPIVSIGAIAATSTLSAGEIDFTGESNFVTAGGFGPNQVSAILGLGALLCLLLVLLEPARRMQLFLMGLGLALIVQALLTFSRGGVLSAALAVLACLLALARHGRAALRLLAPVAVLGVALAFLVVPRLDTFTGGAFTTRFSSLESQRGQLVQEDVQLFRSNPLSGTGAGVASLERGGDRIDARVAAHTEFTRLLAEQGLLGLVAIGVLLWMAGRALVGARPGVPRAVAAALLVWSLTEMSHSAMRVATIPFVFALALGVRNLDDDERPRTVGTMGGTSVDLRAPA